MHLEILSDKQSQLIPLISRFSRSFGLVGGTAFALILGHRRSIDYDLFKYGSLNKEYVLDKIKDYTDNLQIIVRKTQELTVEISGIKTTFYSFPFKVPYTLTAFNNIKMPNLLTLCAMKAYALGQRAKWKDYVDLYFGLKHYSVDEIATRGKEVFKGEFNAKLFRLQLGVFDDISYREQVEFMPGFEVSMDDIKSTLVDISTRI